jgi:peptidoglycan DL-endopeptidase CwlO
MTSRNKTARHRAELQRGTVLASVAKSVSGNAAAMGRQAAVVVAASGLVLSTGVAASADDAPHLPREAVTSALELQPASVAVQASPQVQLSFERPGISSEAAPVAEAPQAEPAPARQKPVQQVTVQEAPAEQAKAEQVAAPARPAPAAPAQPAAQQAPAGTAATAAAAGTPVTSTPAASKPAAAPAASGLAATIVSAAYAQLGVAQDCTALVTNSLRAAGINFHDWPAGYLSLGSTVSAAQAQPGDLVYYADGGMGLAHIAVYVGNGMAVHGGWNGGTTALSSVNVGSGPVFIRVAG